MNTTLRLGMTGDAVSTLQLALVSIGLLAGTPTGSFDAVTQQGVMEMQRRANLPQTGVMDDASWNALYQMQGSVAASDTDPAPQDPPAAPTQGQLLFFGLLAGAVYWFTHKDQGQHQDDEGDDEGEEEEEEEEEDSEEEEEEDEHDDEPIQHSMRDLDDVVTDSLIASPAKIAQGGRPGDCKKAAMRLLRVQALVSRPAERSLYEKTVRKVAADCRGAEDAVEEAIAEEQERRDEAAEAVGAKLIRSPHDTAPGTSHEHGFRKTKHKLTRKTTGAERAEPGQRGRGRRGASAVIQSRGGKRIAKLRKEKTKTKRGYTWRKEEED